MKLVILGATGGIGLEAVRQAISRGHSVTAFVRSPERLKAFGDQITVLQGDLLNVTELARAMGGQDAVLSAFGPRVPIAKSDGHLLQHFAVAFTHAVRQTGVRRAALVSTAFLFRDALFPPAHLVGRIFFPIIVADATEMEEVLTKADFDWTIVRPPQLTDKPLSGKYRIREEHLPIFGSQISRADVAEFLLNTLEKGTSIRKVVGVSN